MPIALIRLIFLILATACGYWMGYRLDLPAAECSAMAMTGFLLAGLFMVVEHNTDIISSRNILLASVGLLFGLLTAQLIATSFPESDLARPIANCVFGYLGVVMALKHADRFNLSKLNFLLRPGHRVGEINIILDTNIIIDGRLKEILPTGFLPGTLIIPQFVIDELQLLADSADSQRRIRGKRGFANLDYLQEIDRKFEIYDVDYTSIRDVDHKLLRLATDIGGTILTNDNNLRSVAQLQGIPVLNINDLTTAVRPVAHVGDQMNVEIVRVGKEPSQGVGYLEDGTMVVVDDGVNLVGGKVDVVVTSVLQTSAGRMIFSRPRAPNHAAEPRESRPRNRSQGSGRGGGERRAAAQ